MGGSGNLSSEEMEASRMVEVDRRKASRERLNRKYGTDWFGR